MEENKRFKLYRIIMLVVLTAFITFMVTSIGLYQHFTDNYTGEKYFISNASNSDDLSERLSRYRAVIDKYYFGDINEEDLVEGAIKGYVEGLGDPYTEYISKDEMQDYLEDTMGNFVGIGIYMAKDTEENKVIVLTPIKGSPAEKAGILSGDYIVEVDGVEYTADDMSIMATKIKGEEGTVVKLKILRDDKLIDFEIKRENVKVNQVEGEVLENDIGYIQFTSFDEGTAEDFKAKYEELNKKNIKSLIIDLRNNGGGIVQEALKIADYIADKGSVLLYEINKNNEEQVEKSENDPIINVPVIILVNGNTASSSEILAGALKDLGKAKIVGETTYGKGVIQQLLTLSDGSGLKITSEEYQTPNRNKINKVGIEPDVVVELPESVTNVLNVKREEDTQLKKAIELLK